MFRKNSSEFSDEQLLTLLGQGNKAAFDLIYNRYFDRLTIYLYKVVKDADETKDLVQELFISLWMRQDELHAIESLQRYLFTSAQYLGLKYVKDNVRKNDFLKSLGEFYTPTSSSFVEQLNANQLSSSINNEIEKLPAKMKEVFILSREENLSHKLIAQKLMISDKTVKKQINNALKLFRLKLAEK